MEDGRIQGWRGKQEGSGWVNGWVNCEEEGRGGRGGGCCVYAALWLDICGFAWESDVVCVVCVVRGMDGLVHADGQIIMLSMFMDSACTDDSFHHVSRGCRWGLRLGICVIEQVICDGGLGGEDRVSGTIEMRWERCLTPKALRAILARLGTFGLNGFGERWDV